jgi:xanthine dehydrogenase accessory factor
VLITTDHISDEAALRRTITSPARYIGMIGSWSKCQTIVEHLVADGLNEQQLARVFAPIGLDLGGPTPQEIALAILAEIVAVRRGGSGQMRSRRAESVSPTNTILR